MYHRTTKDEWQLHVYYGPLHGWEHELTEDTWSDAREQARVYRVNCPQYPCKIVKRRVKIKPEQIAA